MSLVPCPECGADISDRAVLCPHCGLAIRGAYWCWDYRSPRTLWGLPLVHICMGPAIDPTTGNIRVAKGIVAIGPIALGVLSMGGVAIGGLTFGGLALGLVALGGMAFGLGLAIGGLAVGAIALGGGGRSAIWLSAGAPSACTLWGETTRTLSWPNASGRFSAGVSGGPPLTRLPRPAKG